MRLEKQAGPVILFFKVLVSHGQGCTFDPKGNGEPLKEVRFQSGMTTFAVLAHFLRLPCGK